MHIIQVFGFSLYTYFSVLRTTYKTQYLDGLCLSNPQSTCAILIRKTNIQVHTNIINNHAISLKLNLQAAAHVVLHSYCFASWGEKRRFTYSNDSLPAFFQRSFLKSYLNRQNSRFCSCNSEPDFQRSVPAEFESIRMSKYLHHFFESAPKTRD